MNKQETKRVKIYFDRNNRFTSKSFWLWYRINKIKNDGYGRNPVFIFLNKKFMIGSFYHKRTFPFTLILSCCSCNSITFIPFHFFGLFPLKLRLGNSCILYVPDRNCSSSPEPYGIRGSPVSSDIRVVA